MPLVDKDNLRHYVVVSHVPKFEGSTFALNGSAELGSIDEEFNHLCRVRSQRQCNRVGQRIGCCDIYVT